MKLRKERKMMISLAAALICAASMTSCGFVDMLESEETTTSAIFTTTTTKKPRETSHTTKTGIYDGGEVDVDDEDFDGYETTTEVVNQGLENDPRKNDDIDYAMRATQKTEAKTFYTLPEHNGTTASPVTVSEQTTTTEATWKIDLGAATATTTKEETKKNESSAAKTTTTTFDPNKLRALTDDLKYGSDVKFTVTSDTTYLNLRYGPSRSYSIITTIPDGTEIVCKGETYDSDGDYWVYTSYNGTDGWVLKGLLS